MIGLDDEPPAAHAHLDRHADVKSGVLEPGAAQEQLGSAYLELTRLCGDLHSRRNSIMRGWRVNQRSALPQYGTLSSHVEEIVL